MAQQNNDLDKINKNIYIKVYIVNIALYLCLVWSIAYLFGSEFIKTFLFISGALLMWTIFKSFITTITFNLFFKRDLIEKYLHEFKENNFPKPNEYELEEVEAYLQTIAMTSDNHPKNIVATSMLSEFSHARSHGSILVLLRIRKVMRQALKRYNYFTK